MSASSTEKPDAPANRAELLRALTTAQYASGLAFATFGALHVANHLIVPIVQRIGEADRVMSFFRTYYQNPLIEPLIIPTALAVHVASGIAKAYLRPASSVAAVVENQPKPFDAWNRDRQRATGYLLALIVPLHALATRGAALMYLDKPKEMGYGYALYSLIELPAWFVPYYSFLLSLPAAYHIPHGLRFALSYFSLPTYDAATATTIARVLAIGMWATVFKLGAWAWGWIKVKDPLIEFRIPLWRGIAERFFGSSVPKAA